MLVTILPDQGREQRCKPHLRRPEKRKRLYVACEGRPRTSQAGTLVAERVSHEGTHKADQHKMEPSRER